MSRYWVFCEEQLQRVERLIMERRPQDGSLIIANLREVLYGPMGAELRPGELRNDGKAQT